MKKLVNAYNKNVVCSAGALALAGVVALGGGIVQVKAEYDKYVTYPSDYVICDGQCWSSKEAYDTYNAYSILQENGYYATENGEFVDVSSLKMDDQIYVCERTVVPYKQAMMDYGSGKDSFPIFTCELKNHTVNYIYEGEDVTYGYNSINNTMKIR